MEIFYNKTRHKWFIEPFRVLELLVVCFYYDFNSIIITLKALVEQLTYGPAALASFYFGMSLLEGKSLENAADQVKKKFWPSYQVI